MKNKSLDKLTYEELELGEKAVKMYRDGASVEEITSKAPVFLNTRNVFYNLNVTDLAIAGVLGGLNQIYSGDSGTGKSQLAQDFYNYYFGGNKKDGGEAIKVRGYKLTERTLDELIFEELNLEKKRWDLTENVDATLYVVDEINRAPTIKQNDCFELGDGSLNRNGKDILMGRENYHLLIATANLGNGDFKGTFDVDKAMYNRLGIAIDFDYKDFAPEFSDEEFLDVLREANPNLKNSPKRNIVDKVILARNEISLNSHELGLEAKAVLQFLKHGLNNCSKGDDGKLKDKNKKWAIQNHFCQGCTLNSRAPSEYAICSKIKSPVRRTLEATRKYASALDFLIKLKGEKNANPRDIMFKAFELTGAYQSLLNPYILKSKFLDENQEMMKNVSEELKEDYLKNEDRILTTLEFAQKGVSPDSLFAVKTKKGEEKVYSDFDKLDNEKIEKLKKIGMEIDRKKFEFEDNLKLGYSWVQKSADNSVEKE
ncbi:MAG: hypothetical protein NUV46_00700 [Nanoarchaeota archaeon]|nr:hypothetical protein [Nanoarchaeota archaeon]